LNFIFYVFVQGGNAVAAVVHGITADHNSQQGAHFLRSIIRQTRLGLSDCLIYFSFSLSIYLSIYIYIYLSISYPIFVNGCVLG
jgi:hypothetical protein